MRHLNIDIETYSSEDIKKTGMYKYAESEDFEILLFAYSLDGSPVEVIDLTKDDLPDEIITLLRDKNVIKHAYNAAFEWYCLSRYLGLITDQMQDWIAQWEDTMLNVLYCGYPGSLATAGKALNLPEEKLKLSTGSTLIRTFCNPRKPTVKDTRTRVMPKDEPEKWELFKEYNKRDVEVEMEILKRLANFPVPYDIQEQWFTDIHINLRGIGTDKELIENAIIVDKMATNPLIDEAKQITGLDNPNSSTQLMGWLVNKGVKMPNLQKATVDEYVINTLPGDVKRVLEIRQQTSKSSIKKYTSMQNVVSTDNRIRGTLQFYGASRTGRWGGRLIQPQNLPRTYINKNMLDFTRTCVKNKLLNTIDMCVGPMSNILSQLVRTALAPTEGKVFVDADFSSIEARVIAWLAGEEWILDVFRTHGKIYEAQAAKMFDVPIEKIKKGNPEYELRAKGKVATLALGYGGGVDALVNMGALDMGIPEEELDPIKNGWRQSNKNIVSLWYEIQNNIIKTAKDSKTRTGKGLIIKKEFDEFNTFLTITLPSKRKLFYANPSVGKGRFSSEEFKYTGVNQTSKKWENMSAWGGKLVENIVQAIARDCLAVAINRITEAGYDIVFHVHDEVVVETENKDALNEIIKLMSLPIDWAEGLPLNADGWVGEYYTKD